eukprot:COSAG02_NODE_2688_length_8234_cov_45.754230_3_plen_217_part_00
MEGRVDDSVVRFPPLIDRSAPAYLDYAEQQRGPSNAQLFELRGPSLHAVAAMAKRRAAPDNGCRSHPEGAGAEPASNVSVEVQSFNGDEDSASTSAALSLYSRYHLLVRDGEQIEIRSDELRRSDEQLIQQCVAINPSLTHDGKSSRRVLIVGEAAAEPSVASSLNVRENGIRVSRESERGLSLSLALSLSLCVCVCVCVCVSVSLALALSLSLFE